MWKLVVLAIFLISLWGWRKQPEVQIAEVPPKREEITPHINEGRRQQTTNGVVSPFGQYVPETTHEMNYRRELRRKRMSGKYMTPPEYFTMNLAQLTALAKGGDVYAMIQLGEQFAHESSALERDPAYDWNNKNSMAIADRHFASAIAGGYTVVAGAQALRYAQAGSPVEAYAWSLVAERFNDRGSLVAFARTGVAEKLSKQELQAGELRFVELWQQIEGR